MAKRRGTDGSLLTSLPWTIGALVFALAPHLPYLSIWITLVFMACAAWRYLIEKRRMALPPMAVRAILAVSCFVGVLSTYGDISGVGPGSALLTVMAAMKLLETRKRRDQFVLLFISIFLVMSTVLREQYLWSLPYLIAAVALIMTAWLRMSATRQETARDSFHTSKRLLLYAAPLALAMWIFFPRISTPFWGVPIDTSMATSGISNTLSPGDISELSLSDAVAFRVDFKSPIPEARDLYWRGLVLTHFTGRTWSGREQPGHAPGSRDTIEVDGEPVSYRITIEPTRQPYVFALDIPFQWSLPNAAMGLQQQITRAHPIDQRIAYDAISYPRYSVQRDMSRTAKNWYSKLPAERNPRTRELALDMFAQAGSEQAFIDAVLRKFNQEEYFYTLRPPALGNNSVDRFLFDTKQGFCEHYASAFAVMMRAAGIPARIVLGYQGGELNPLGDYMIVRQSDAHAWTEVWLENRGWVRVDPTSAVAPQRIEAGMRGSLRDGSANSWGLTSPAEWLHSLGLSWDAINAKWNAWVLGYGPENQDRFMQFLGIDNPDWQNKVFTLIGVGIALILGISLLLALRYRAPRPDPAQALYLQFEKKTGLERATGETPNGFAIRAQRESPLDDDTITDITEAYLAARYGSPDPNALSQLESRVNSLP
ncbi:MAG: DUF3488 and transglutaminase-like domain-containing protein [Pseudomonadota bacterium]